MDFIHTTATAVEKLNRLAKSRRKDTGGPLAYALDAVARVHGYAHWKHVTVCREQTIQRTERAAASRVLPRYLLEFLHSAATRSPTSPASSEAFARGLAFAMDVKDADEAARMPYCVECPDAWHIAAPDLWHSITHDDDLGTDGSPVEARSPDDLLFLLQDELSNLRFFRYLKTPTPESLEAAFKHVFQRIFFAPAFVWLNGKFVDTSLIPEMRVDGKVIFSSNGGMVIYSPEGAQTRLERFGHLLTDEERELTKHMTSDAVESMIFHEIEKRTPEGKSRYQSLQTSTSISWGNARKPGHNHEEHRMSIDPAHTELANKLRALHLDLEARSLSGTSDHRSARALEDKIGSGQEATEENIARATALLRKYAK